MRLAPLSPFPGTPAPNAVASPHHGEDLARAYAEILPDGLPIELMGIVRYQPIEAPKAATPADYEAFYRKLAASGHQCASVAGRYMLLRTQIDDYFRRRYETGQQDTRFLESLRPELQKLREACRSLPHMPDVPNDPRLRLMSQRGAGAFLMGSPHSDVWLVPESK